MANLYYGAYVVLADENNPERISQSAHSLRELLDKMPRWWDGAPVLQRGRNTVNMKSKLNDIQKPWKQANETYTENGILDWNGDVKPELIIFLYEFEKFQNWVINERPKRSEEVRSFLATESQLPEHVPDREEAEKERIKRWVKLYGILSNISHHGESTTDYSDIQNRFEEYLTNEVLFDIQPTTFKDIRLLDDLIKEGEADA